MDLDGHTALVTGSARGLGRSVALALADRGADVAVHYRTSADAAALAADEARAAGVDAVTVQGDVTDPDAVDGIFDDVETALGSVSIMVQNVGRFDPRHWTDLDPDDWHRVIDTNLTATYLCCRRALPAMRGAEDHAPAASDAAGGARIVTIGYADADRGLVSPVNLPYFIAKAGVLQFTRAVAADTASDPVTINAVSPYVIENSDAFPDDLPGGRPATLEEVTRAVLFFMDPANDHISGENLNVDGGWLPENV